MKTITTHITCLVELKETFIVNDDVFAEIQELTKNLKSDQDQEVMNDLYSHLEIHALQRDLEYYYVCDDQEETIQINEINFEE